MSAIKSKYEHKTILDFSDKKVTRNSIQKSLRQAEFIQTYYENSGVSLTYIDNEIIVGMYKIRLFLDVVDGAKKLRDYGRFQISIQGGSKWINLTRDSRFKSQTWIKSNENNQLNISHLVDIILHCQRLDKLKSFL